MCGIFGVLAETKKSNYELNFKINELIKENLKRGSDGLGYNIQINSNNISITSNVRIIENINENKDFADAIYYFPKPNILKKCNIQLIGNCRAEPTTEYVKNKTHFDQQPYKLGSWTIVHNGTIANDEDIRTKEYPSDIDSAAIVEILRETEFPSWLHAANYFAEKIYSLIKGSYAILATHDSFPNIIFAGCNYKPIWYSNKDKVTFIGSTRESVSALENPQMLKPYSFAVFKSDIDQPLIFKIKKDKPKNKKAYVICSGGLDSTVAAYSAVHQDYDVTLIHFIYDSRAQDKEYEAIEKISSKLNVPFKILAFPAIYAKTDSPLLQKDSNISDGVSGAEFANEWVPARNLMMLAMTTAVAEAKGVETLVVGTNIEEAGAYPDNEPEFLARFNDMLPFAIGPDKSMQVITPVGNMTKREIVALGGLMGVPFELTWSCYKDGEKHCGRCGPCHMRREAFSIAEVSDPTEYEA